ncbi:MAG TPA: DUF5317 family protein [Chloroflexota bacterium]|jgi:hypothetical protein
MILVLGAIVAGMLVGLIMGGSIRQLAEIRLRWWPLALLGLALQLVPVPSMRGQLDHWLAVGLLIASYMVLLGFVAANIRLPGFWIIAVGFALNVVVIAINGGMPVSKPAIEQAYGSRNPAILNDLKRNGGAKHHLQRPDDVLIPLTDVIPLGTPVRLVLSVGDVLFFVGVTWVIAAATKGPAGRHRPGAGRDGSDSGWEVAEPEPTSPDPSSVRSERAEFRDSPPARAPSPPP